VDNLMYCVFLLIQPSFLRTRWEARRFAFSIKKIWQLSECRREAALKYTKPVDFEKVEAVLRKATSTNPADCTPLAVVDPVATMHNSHSVHSVLQASRERKLSI
jgi:hypothetical protein